MALGFTGPMLRGSGVEWMCVKSNPTKSMTLRFDIPVGTNGDCYDRYLVRVAEMRESTASFLSVSAGYVKTQVLGSQIITR